MTVAAVPAALQWAQFGLGALGGLAGGIGGAQGQRAQAKEQGREFDINSVRDYILRQQQLQQSQGAQAQGALGALQTAPIRDRLLYLLSARAGLSPGQFTGHVAGFDQNVPQQGGIPAAAMQQAQQQYQPGAGGIANAGTTSLNTALLANLGYNRDPASGSFSYSQPRPNAPSPVHAEVYGSPAYHSFPAGPGANEPLPGPGGVMGLLQKAQQDAARRRAQQQQQAGGTG